MAALSVITTVYLLVVLAMLIASTMYNHSRGELTPAYIKVIAFVGTPMILAIINIWVLFANLG